MAPKKEEKSLHSAALYTIGWIAALKHERAAATVLLDERHGRPEGFVQNQSDSNSYTWGRMGRHNIVIASLPAGVYGLVEAASTAGGLLASLPHIRIGLLVGIGAGVPNGHSILLGDVVMSQPDGTNGGVVQYDLFKAKRDDETGLGGSKERKGFMSSPPRVLLNALSALQTEHEVYGSEMEVILGAFRGNERMRMSYGFPGAQEDILRRNVPEPRLSSEVHYGTIASGNVLIKDASEREEIVKWLRQGNVNPLCFEMEAAGLMNNFPCIVIRGICDYADENKNDIWQKYAAATAAACARELLDYVDVQDVDGTAKIGDVMNDISNLRRDVREGLSELRTDMSTKAERELLQTSLDEAKGASYNSYTNEHAATCLKGTRTDLLEEILAWSRDPDGKCIFWLCGKAGMGKSTIARTIADSLDASHRLGASFFFKRGEADRKNASKFFPTIVMQLSRVITDARSAIAEALEADPTICTQGLKQQFEKLLLGPITPALHQQSLDQPLVIVVDAMDECEDEQEIRAIIGLLARLHDVGAAGIRVLATSGPELPVQLGFSDVKCSLYKDIKLEVVQADTIDNDIRVYLAHQFKTIRQKMILRNHEPPPPDWPGPANIERLVKLAVPLFIFAFTICRYISERDSQRRLESVLERKGASSFSGLAMTYKPILRHAMRDHKGQDHIEAITLFREIVGSIILLADPLPASSLSALLNIPNADITETLCQLHSVLDIPMARGAPVRLLHESFRDFLLDPAPEQADEFYVEATQTHLKLAERCINRLEHSGLLKADICDLEEPGIRRTNIDKRYIKDCIPDDIAYACFYWVSHLVQSGQKLNDNGSAHRFLQHHFLHWAEVLTWLGQYSRIITDIAQLQSCLEADASRELSAFMDDALRFVLKFRYAIELAPLQLYYSALVFAPKNSIIRQTFWDAKLAGLTLYPEIPLDWSAERQTLEGHRLTVPALAFSADGRLLASGSRDFTARVWDVMTGEMKQVLEGHVDTVSVVHFHPNGKLLASGSHDRTVRVWDIVTGEQLRIFTGNEEKVIAVAFSSDGKSIASLSTDGTAHVLNPDQGDVRQVLRLGVTYSPIGGLTFSHDSKLLTVCCEKQVTVWRRDAVAGGASFQLEWQESCTRLKCLALSLDGSQIAAADSWDRLWTKRFGVDEQLQELPGPHREVKAVAITSDNEQLISAKKDGTVQLWRVATREQIQVIKTRQYNICTLALSLDCKLLVSASLWEGIIRTWHVVADKQELENDSPKDGVSEVLFSFDGRLLVSRNERSIRLWDVASGRQQKAIEVSCHRMAISPDRQLLAVACEEGTWLLDLASGAQKQKLSGLERWVMALIFSPNSESLVSVAGNSTVNYWDIKTGQQKQRFEASGLDRNLWVWSGDGALLAFVCSGFVTICDIAAGQQRRKLEIETDTLDRLALSHDGELALVCNSHPKRLAIGSERRSSIHTISLWSTVSGEQKLTLDASGHINCMVISHNNILIAWLCADGKLEVYDIVTQNRWEALKGAVQWCHRMELAADGKSLRTAFGEYQLKFDVSDGIKSLTLDAPIERHGAWLRCHGEDVLWLPHDYRQHEQPTVACQDTIAIGTDTGDVAFFRV